MSDVRVSPGAPLVRAFGVPAWWLACLLLVLLCAGCGSLPQDVRRPESRALAAPGETPLGQLAARRRPAGARASESGFALIDSADLAFSARLALAQGARRTLDVQYYAIHADPGTAELLRELRLAAARGVRVRLLLDDFNSGGRDSVVLGMARVPNVEMRLFNPLPGGARGAGALRTLAGLRDFRRLQHRMHNKLFVADNAWGITGGRNLGDAYFGAAEGSNFIDMDVLASGAVVRDMSASFDRYWNNPLAYPVPALVGETELRRLHDQLLAPTPADAAPAVGNTTEPGNAAPSEKTVRMPPPAELATLPLTWANAHLLSDKPFKLVPELNDSFAEDSVVDNMLVMMQAARGEVLIVTPYFVPGARMMQVFADMRRRGVRVRVLTNSLASNDAPLAHVGYARYREQLLRLGVELHEMRALQGVQLDRTVFGSGRGPSRASLHAKLLIFDGRLLSVGSMNLDPRSDQLNTEVTVVVRSRRLSQRATEVIERAIAGSAWRLALNAEGQLHWHAPPGAGFEDADSEPDASAGLRLVLGVLGPVAPEEML